ncbi:MAG TPA: hypothetical protein VIL28_10510 [Steroidobacteraceae bacterium]
MTRVTHRWIGMRNSIQRPLGARVRHRYISSAGVCRRSALLCALGLASLCKVHAQEVSSGSTPDDSASEVARCLPAGDGYFRARLDGVLKTELDWGNEGTECTGGVRPTDGGIRMRFTSRLDSGEKLVIVVGIARLREGQNAKAVPVNITVIREGTGEFYGTLGDDKCMLDEVRQEPIVGIPHRSRSYRVVARGFCTEPARAVRGQGAVLLSRFDYAGRVDFDSEDKSADVPQVAMR